jgi:CzcA family heavy metal efflux pump
MIQRLVEGSLRHRELVLVLAAGFLVYGAWTARRAPLDVLPDFAPPEAVIQTEAPGFAPDQVERFVTLPIESALGGVAGLETLRSESIQGLSVVTAVFAETADPLRARQLVAESLGDLAARFPSGVGAPRLSPLTSATMDVLKIGLQSSALSPMELRGLADWTVRPRLLMVPGVARVNVFGGEVREIRIETSPERLRAHGLALADLLAAAAAATASPGGGFVDTINQRIVIDAANVDAAADAIGEVVVGGTAGAVRLRDVADVREVAAPAFGDALIRGEPGVLLTLSAAYGANTLDVTRRVETALADLRPLFDRQQVTLHPDLHRPADFIESALSNLGSTLAVGSVLVIFVLVAFLRDARAAAVSLVAIPLSLLAAIAVLVRLGATLDTMSLGGLAIAIGEVVDDAIVDVENVQRRLRENEARGRPRTAFEVVLAASLEVRGAVLYATLSLALVFAPLLALEGLAGKFFAPLAMSYLAAVFASLLTALTVTPAFALTVFARRPLEPEAPTTQRRVRETYARWLGRLREQPLRIAVPVAATAVLALVALPFVGGELLPEFREEHLVVQLAMTPGTSIDEMRRVGASLSQRLLALPGVRTLEEQIGRAEAGEDTWGPQRAEMHVELVRGADSAATAEAVRGVLDAAPGVESEVLSFLGDRISETISGETAEVAVSVFSEDLDALDATAASVASALGEVRGAVDVRVGSAALGPELAVRLRPDRLRVYGLRPDDVLGTIQAAYAGASVGQVQRGDQPIDVRVALTSPRPADPAAVSALLVGGAVPLGEVADVTTGTGRASILHEGGRRRQVVTCNVEGRDVSSFADEARARIGRDVAFPRGGYFVVGGAAAARTQAVRDLALRAVAGGVGILLLLFLATGHVRNVALLAGLAPLALAGGVLATVLVALLGGREPVLSLGALVGFATLFGVTTRHGIMMLTRFRQLVQVEGLPWDEATALRGAVDRVVPVLMTTLVTALALLPVALGGERPGGEIDGPMAVVILGGLMTSSALTLLALPRLALRFGRFERPQEPSPPAR